jgi:ADP-dependent NAD(P)H-hydrate dehydratase
MPASPPAEVDLAGFPLPGHDDGSSKHDRGTVVVLGGSPATPGAVLLAGLAALRAGAGRLRIVTVTEAVPGLGVAVPEALVSDDPERACDGAAAALVGSGALDDDVAARWLDAAIAALAADGVLVVDAGALPAAVEREERLRALDGRVLLTPNPAELEVFGTSSPDDLPAVAERFGAVVALRGPETFVASPGEGAWVVERSGSVGLATSGSGDVAAGLAAGLAARGADPVTAAVWAAAVHGWAGERLAATVGPLSFLARELLDEIPRALEALAQHA